MVTASTISSSDANANISLPDISRYALSDAECERLSQAPNIGGLTLELIPQCANFDGTYNRIMIDCEELSSEGVSISYQQSLTEITSLCGDSIEYASRRFFDITANLSRGVTSQEIMRLVYSGEAIEQSGDYNRFKVLSNLNSPLAYFMLILRPVSNPNSEFIVFPRVYLRSDSIEQTFTLDSPRTTTLNLRAVYANLGGDRVVAEFYQRRTSTLNTADADADADATNDNVSTTIFTA